MASSAVSPTFPCSQGVTWLPQAIDRLPAKGICSACRCLGGGSYGGPDRAIGTAGFLSLPSPAIPARSRRQLARGGFVMPPGWSGTRRWTWRRISLTAHSLRRPTADRKSAARTFRSTSKSSRRDRDCAGRPERFRVARWSAGAVAPMHLWSRPRRRLRHNPPRRCRWECRSPSSS